ncbi:MAG: hypothetical protein KDD48_08495 [Bdellovibrionales bacterium]|nr:hypothetical protein [Bdellovibrionales bacterium]
MKTYFYTTKTLPWMMALFVACMTFSLSPARAEGEEHNHSHEQESATKKVEDNHDPHEDEHKEKGAKHEAHEEGSDHDDHEGKEEHGEHEEGSRKVGEGKAVVEFHDDKGFRLSSEAYQSLGIAHQEVKGRQFEIPKKALVRIKNTTSVYRYHDHFFKLVPVKVIREGKNQYVLRAPLKTGDRVVIEGMELLRVADIYSQDTSDYSHGH